MITYDRFQDIEPIDEGGLMLMDKIQISPVTVALKKLKNSDNMEAFINEVKVFKLFYFIYLY